MFSHKVTIRSIVLKGEVNIVYKADITWTARRLYRRLAQPVLGRINGLCRAIGNADFTLDNKLKRPTVEDRGGGGQDLWMRRQRWMVHGGCVSPSPIGTSQDPRPGA